MGKPKCTRHGSSNVKGDASLTTKKNKQHVHTWVRRILNSNTCPGAQWIDKSNGIFQICWYNQKNQKEWKEEYCQIFLEYAKYTGKWKPNDEKDFPKFKQNFKSAIYKNSYIDRLENPSKNLRMYRLNDLNSQDEERKGLAMGDKIESFEGIFDGGSVQTDGMRKADYSGESCASSQKDFLIISGDSNVFSQFVRSREESNMHSYDSLLVPASEEIVEPQMTKNDLSVLPNGFSNSNMDTHSGNLILGELNVSLVGRDNQSGGNNKLVSSLVQSYELQTTDVSCLQHIIQSGTIDSTTDLVIGVDANDHAMIAKMPDVNAGLSKSDNEVFPPIDACTKNDFLLLKNTVMTKNILDSHSQISYDLSSSMDTSEKNTNAIVSKASCSNSSELTSSNFVVTIHKHVLERDLMRLQIIYGSPHRVVLTTIVKTNSCRIFYGKVNNKRIEQELLKKYNGLEIELPSVEILDFKDKYKARIRDALKMMEMGIQIVYKNEDIHVIRRCQRRVYLSDGVLTSTLLPRITIEKEDDGIKAFNFQDNFQASIQHYQQKGDPVDKTYFLLTIGCEILKNDQSPTRVLPVFIQVEHTAAVNMRCTALGPKALEPDPTHSLSDSFDNMMRLANKFD